MAILASQPSPRGDGFQRIASGFLSQEGLPFASILSAETIESVFSRHGSLFGLHGVYSTMITVWSFLGQVLRDGKEAACQAAVARIVSYCQLVGRTPPTSDTGDYCRARAKLSIAALRELCGKVAEEMQAAADPRWLWKGLHAKLIDGFTFTMPDTPSNQAAYPQQRCQAPGTGEPIARVVTILSLATACVIDAALGPYRGKQTGETALLRSLLHRFDRGDIAVADRYYCSFMMIGMLLARGAQVCARKHQLRHTDFRRGIRLGKYDHLIAWPKSPRPDWMDAALYAEMPKLLLLREIRYNVVEKGRRTKTLTIITTLLDPDEFTKEEIAELYGFRWNAELDIRSIKGSLHLEHARCKTSAMVHREFWTTFLAYNLIRTTAAAAALLHGKQPRQISFTGTCQYVLSAWMLTACLEHGVEDWLAFFRKLLSQIAECEVANRPGRLEPRVVKRRPKQYKRMRRPREVLRRELRKHCT